VLLLSIGRIHDNVFLNADSISYRHFFHIRKTAAQGRRLTLVDTLCPLIGKIRNRHPDCRCLPLVVVAEVRRRQPDLAHAGP